MVSEAVLDVTRLLGVLVHVYNAEHLGMPFKKVRRTVKTRRHCNQKLSSGNTVQDPSEETIES